MTIRIMLAVLVYFTFLGTVHYTIYADRDKLSNQLNNESRLLTDQINMAVAHTALTADALTMSLETRKWHTSPNQRLQTFLSSNVYEDFIRHIMIFDKAGIQRSTSFADYIPNLNISDRPYYKLVMEGEDGFWFGPFIGRTTQLPSYGYVRALHDDKQNIEGLLLTVLSVEYLNQICARSVTGERTEALIVTEDGSVVAGCGLDAEVIAKQPHFSAVFMEGHTIELQPRPATEIGGHLVTVSDVSKSGKLKLLVAIDLDKKRSDYIQHMMTYGIALALVFLILFAFPTRITRT